MSAAGAATAVLRRPARRPGLRGHPHLRHLRPGEPGHDRRRQAPATASRPRYSTPDAPRRAAARTPRPPCRTPARGNLYIYNGGSSGTCTCMDIVKIKHLGPDRRRRTLRRAPRGRQCHDNTVFINGANSLAVVRRRQRRLGVQVRHDDRPAAAGRHREPDAAVVASRCTRRQHRPLGHVQLRRQDGRLRPRAGRRHVRPQCQTTSSARRTARCSSWTPRPATDLGTLLHPRAADEPRELHVAQLQHRADQGRQLPASPATTRPASTWSTSRTRPRRR